MQLHYFKSEAGNFGDDLNPWLFSRLSPSLLDDDDPRVLVAIGSLLNLDLNDFLGSREAFILGAGIGYGPIPTVRDNWRFFAVRGRRSQVALELPVSTPLGDAAILLRSLRRGPEGTSQHEFGFMPHHNSCYSVYWTATCRVLGIHYIDPRQKDAGRVIDEIANCRCLITEAMHGAIVADCLRIPWVPIQLYDHIDRAKWDDWGSALGMAPQFVPWGPLLNSDSRSARLRAQILAPIALARCQRRSRDMAQLSEEPALDACHTRLGEAFERLCDEAERR